jgi:hypothetical protein
VSNKPIASRAGADPAAVVLAFEGAQGLRVDDGSDPIMATEAGELRLRRPVIYQEVSGDRRLIDGGYVPGGDRVRFRVASFDASIEPGAQPTRSFRVRLSNPRGGATLGPRTSADVRIVDTK